MRTVKRGVACAAAVAWLVLGGGARAAVVTQYSFQGNLLDTAPAGGAADHLTATPASAPLSVSYQPGIVGQAVRVSRDPGEAAVLMAADSNDLDLAASWTVEAFVKPDAANSGEWDRFATKWFDTAGEWHWAFRYGNNGQDLFLNGGQVINGAATGTVPLDQWSHVAMTGSPADGITLWQDGAVVGTAPYQAVVPNTNAFRIGNRVVGEGAFQFSGLVDEFLIHDTAQAEAYMQGRAALLPPPPPPPARGLLSFYGLEGNGDDTAADYVRRASTNADNLTIVGNVAFVPGLVGQAADLDGGYFTAPNLSVDDLHLTDTFTIEAWINPDAPNKSWNRLVLNWGAPGQRGYHFALRDNDVNFFVSTDGWGETEVATGGDVQASIWQHIAAVSDGTTLKLYLDGLEVASGLLPAGAPFATSTEGLGVGDSASSPWADGRYVGLLDELALWNVALDPGEIADHYARGARGYGLALIPEPASLTLLALGGLALARRQRRRPSRPRRASYRIGRSVRQSIPTK